MDIKIYQKMNEYIFFSIYKIVLTMIEKENNKYWSAVINNAKNEKFREKSKNLPPLIFEIKNKKSKNFQKAVKKLDENYEFNHPLIERHFLYKALQEINKELTKIKKIFYLILLVDYIKFLKMN